MPLFVTTPSTIEHRIPPLDSVLASIGEDLERVDQEFRRNLCSSVPIISAIGEHLLFSGGKRFRPMLLLLSAKLCGYEGDQHIALASLVEFIHTATLLHDDVVDRAQLRRGNLSANAIWGNEACVLVGDFLFTKCFSIMVDNGNLKILRTISRATTLMAEGELDELMRTNDLFLTEEGYLSIVARKTGALIAAAAQIGGILGNISEEKERALTDFGMDLGIAFQLIDDNLDYSSREEEFGKKIGIDLQDGKITLPLIHTLRRCRTEEKEFIQRTVETDPISKEDFFRVVDLIEGYDGLRYTWNKAKEYVERAKRSLDLFPDSREKEGLHALADYVLHRKL